VLLSSLTSRRTVQVTKLDCWFQVRFLGLHNVEFSHFIFIVDAVCSSAIELTVMSKIFTAKYCKSKSWVNIWHRCQSTGDRLRTSNRKNICALLVWEIVPILHYVCLIREHAVKWSDSLDISNILFVQFCEDNASIKFMYCAVLELSLILKLEVWNQESSDSQSALFLFVTGEFLKRTRNKGKWGNKCIRWSLVDSLVEAINTTNLLEDGNVFSLSSQTMFLWSSFNIRQA
jgi:hypothetical protein